jgi:hypothetical protein
MLDLLIPVGRQLVIVWQGGVSMHYFWCMHCRCHQYEGYWNDSPNKHWVLKQPLHLCFLATVAQKVGTEFWAFINPTWEESYLVTESVGLAKSSLSLEVLHDIKKWNLQLQHISHQLNARTYDFVCELIWLREVVIS